MGTLVKWGSYEVGLGWVWRLIEKNNEKYAMAIKNYLLTFNNC